MSVLLCVCGMWGAAMWQMEMKMLCILFYDFLFPHAHFFFCRFTTRHAGIKGVKQTIISQWLVESLTLLLNHQFPWTEMWNCFSSLLYAWHEEIRARVKQMAWLWLRHSSKTPHHVSNKLKSWVSAVCLMSSVFFLLCETFYYYQTMHVSVHTWMMKVLSWKPGVRPSMLM